MVRKLPRGRLVIAYAREYGLLKLTGNNLGGRGEPFVENILWVNMRNLSNDIHTIKASEFQRHFKLDTDLDKLMLAWQYCELLQNCSHFQEERSAEIFDLLVDSLADLETCLTSRIYSISVSFLWNLIELLGYKPDFSILNSHKIPEKLYFDLIAGTLSPNNLSKNRQEIIEILPNIQNAFLSLHNKRAPEEIALQVEVFIHNILIRYLQRQTDCRLKSSKTMKQLRGNAS